MDANFKSAKSKGESEMTKKEMKNLKINRIRKFMNSSIPTPFTKPNDRQQLTNFIGRQEQEQSPSAVKTIKVK